eukprot:UN23406
MKGEIPYCLSRRQYRLKKKYFCSYNQSSKICDWVILKSVIWSFGPDR